jgi:adenosylcobinamide kinase / adenosylcobinamide-phosphate guanylyltransferase
MGRIILVTGGARSGKSTYAEEMAAKLDGNVLYIATSIPFDDEMKLRVTKHKAQRPSRWDTLEAYKDMDINLKSRLENSSGVLLDCITIMVTNLFMEKCKDLDNISNSTAVEVEDFIKSEIEKLIKIAKNTDIPFIIVTNEVGMGIVPEYPSGRVFRDLAGRANQMLAKVADEVYLCVSGIPVKIK